MTWVIENKSPASKVAVINLKVCIPVLKNDSPLESYSGFIQINSWIDFYSSLDKLIWWYSNFLREFLFGYIRHDFQLQDYGKNPAGETEVQFRLTRVTLEPMLKSMSDISQQLSLPANRVAVINLKVCIMNFKIYFLFQNLSKRVWSSWTVAFCFT